METIEELEHRYFMLKMQDTWASEDYRYADKEIAERLHKTEDEVKALFSYFDTLSNFERDLSNIDTKSR